MVLAQSWGPWPPVVTFHPAGTRHSPLLRKQRTPGLLVAVSNYFFFLPLQNKHLRIQCIFKEMDQHGYSGRHKAHRGVGQIPNLRKSRSVYVNHTSAVIGRRLNPLPVCAPLALLGTFGGTPQTIVFLDTFPSLIAFLYCWFYFNQTRRRGGGRDWKLQINFLISSTSQSRHYAGK